MSDNTMGEGTKSVSQRFDAADPDVVCRSCNNVLFKIHRKNLEFAAGCFPPAGFEALNEIIPLTEQSSTLEILFQYVYPMRQPGISSEPFENLALIAEAAEKYQVFSAMCVCKISMQSKLPHHALEIFLYAVKHGYNDIIDKAAVYIVERPLAEVLPILPGLFIIPLVRYHTAWEELLSEVRSYPLTSMFVGMLPKDTPCSQVMQYTTRLNTIRSLRDPPKVLEPEGDLTWQMIRLLPLWQAEIEKSIQDIKPFLSHLEPNSA